MIGLTEQEGIAAGDDCWCNTLVMSLVPRAGAIRGTRGITKMVADKHTNEVLGVSMVGNGAGEVNHEAAMALRFRAKLQDFIDMLHVYPDDGRGSENRRRFAVQKPSEAFVLRRIRFSTARLTKEMTE